MAIEGVTLSIADALSSVIAFACMTKAITLRASSSTLQNPAFAQLVADAIGKPLSLLESGAASAIGAAILSGIAAGIYNGIVESIQEAGLAVRAEIHPDEARHQELAERLEIVRQVYKSGLFKITSALNG